MLKRRVIVCWLCAAACVSAAAGTLTVVDAIPGGDSAVRELLLSLARKNPGFEPTLVRKSGAEALAELDAGRAGLILLSGAVPPRRTARPYVWAAAVVLVHRDNPFPGTTVAQLSDVYAGKIENWKSLNGTPFEIHRYGQKLPSPGEAVFQRKAMGDRSGIQTVFRTGTMRELVLMTGAEPNALAVCSFGSIAGSPVRAVPVGGVMPYPEEIRSGRYPLSEPRFAVVGVRPSPEAAALLRAFESAAFADIAARHELLPVEPLNGGAQK